MEYPFKDLLPLDEVLEREGYYKDWTHLDPEVFYSLTQISEYIKTKGYGVDVRLLIAQLAEHFGLKTTQVVDLGNLIQAEHATLKQQVQQAVAQVNADRNALETKFNQSVAQMEADKNAVIANATVDSEVILARGGKPTLGARLDETTAQLAQKDEYEVDLLNYKELFTVNPSETTLDITQALKQAIEDVAPYPYGHNWSSQSKTIKIPAQKFIISETIKYKSGLSIVGSGLGTEIISKVPAGEGTFDVADTANWEMKDIMLHGDGTNHGIITTRDYTKEVNMVRYKLTNVYTRYFDIGLDLQGFIGVLDKVRSNHNKIGLILEQANAIGVSACAFEQNTDTGVILKGGAGVHFNNGTVIEGNGLYELDVQGGQNVTFDAVYFENANNFDVLSTILVGVNGDKRVFDINFDNCYFGGGSAQAGIIDKVTNITFKNVISDNMYRGFKITENAINVNFENTYLHRVQLAEHGTSIQPNNPKNLLPNHDFSEWEVEHSPSDWIRRYALGDGRNTVDITKETVIKRQGSNAMRLTHLSSSGGATALFVIPEHLIPILKNKKVTLGAWIYIPDNEHFGDYLNIKPGPGIDLTGGDVERIQVERISTLGGNNTYKKGQWNFFQNTYYLGENIAFDNLVLNLRVTNGPGENTTGKYVIVDSVYLVEGLYTAGDLAQNVIS